MNQFTQFLWFWIITLENKKTTYSWTYEIYKIIKQDKINIIFNWMWESIYYDAILVVSTTNLHFKSLISWAFKTKTII